MRQIDGKVHDLPPPPFIRLAVQSPAEKREAGGRADCVKRGSGAQDSCPFARGPVPAAVLIPPGQTDLQEEKRILWHNH